MHIDLRQNTLPMYSRRTFLTKSTLGSIATFFGITNASCQQSSNSPNNSNTGTFPLVISTWKHGLAANEGAWKVITSNGKAIDAVEQGVRVTEADPESTSVGYGGLPDRDGNVTLDACIMDSDGNCGSVCFLQNIKHPISVARKVMDETPHVILAGAGALKFAVSKGFKEEDLLTENSRKAWEAWKIKSDYKPIINVENHDTIGMLAIDQSGNIAGACTTSGLAYKMQGRVGDSPIIGAGLFIDNEIGGAVATGLGEEILKTLGSFLIVELMRQGKSPQEACDEAILRIVKSKDVKDLQIGYIAINKKGEVGAKGIHEGFNYALNTENGNELIDAPAYF